MKKNVVYANVSDVMSVYTLICINIKHVHSAFSIHFREYQSYLVGTMEEKQNKTVA